MTQWTQSAGYTTLTSLLVCTRSGRCSMDSRSTESRTDETKLSSAKPNGHAVVTGSLATRLGRPSLLDVSTPRGKRSGRTRRSAVNESQTPGSSSISHTIERPLRKPFIYVLRSVNEPAACLEYGVITATHYKKSEMSE